MSRRYFSGRAYQLWSTTVGMLLCFSVFGFAGEPFKAERHAALEFSNGHKIVVDLADTPEGRERGLMFRKKLAKDYGMLFVFPSETVLPFWMKNTWASLDMVYISADKRITTIFRRVKASTSKTTDEEVARVEGRGQYVLELPAGASDRQKLKIGQVVKFDAPIPER